MKYEMYYQEQNGDWEKSNLGTFGSKREINEGIKNWKVGFFRVHGSIPKTKLIVKAEGGVTP